MSYRTEKTIINDSDARFHCGDVVTVKFNNGGGVGGCKITKITDTGFRYCQGSGSEKTLQYKNIKEVWLNEQISI